MSEGDVSLIRDEDVLRRMWQQTEDFSRKKEIRAHMYRLREERLRNLYASQTQHHTKGVEAAGSHVSSLVDQSFQGLKSKEVRDAASPPKVFHGADLKELSNAGWNVESENRTTNDGHTQIRSVQANIEGRYDVEGGAGKFAAIDQQQQAATEYHDDKTSLKRNESSAKSEAQEQVFRKTDNGAEFSSTKSSSSSSQFHEESSTKYEVPYPNDDYDLSRKTNYTNQNKNITNTSSYEQSLKNSDFESGELISRKVDYPDDNTKVIVETRCLPDGTRVTNTRREFRAPAQTTRSEQRSQTKSESKSYSTTSQQRSDVKSHRIVSNDHTDIVDSQRYADDYDFKRNEINYLNQENERTESQQTKRQETKRIDKKESSSSMTKKTIEKQDFVDRKSVDHKNVQNEIRSDHQTEHDNKRENYSRIERNLDQRHTSRVDEIDHCENVPLDSVKKVQDVTTKQNNFEAQKSHKCITKENYVDIQLQENKKVNETSVNDKKINDYRYTKDNEDVNKKEKMEEVVEKINKSDHYQTTYQSDYTQKKISSDLSSSHQAWASTLRADTPSSTRPTTRASSPGSKTYQSSTSSLRSSISPDKTYRKPTSRGGSPTKSNLSSHTYTDRYSSTHSTTSSTNETRYTSPDRKPPRSPARSGLSPDREHPDHRPRVSQSPEKRPQTHHYSPSPERKRGQPAAKEHPKQHSSSPHRSGLEKDISNRQSPEKQPGFTPSSHSPDRKTGNEQPSRSSVSPDRKPGYMRPTESQTNRDSSVKHAPSPSPERKPHSKVNNINKEHYKFIDEETKMYSRTDPDNFKYTRNTPSPDRFKQSKSPSPMRSTPDNDSDCRSESPIRPTLRKTIRSPSPPKGPVTFTKDTKESTIKSVKTSNYSDDEITFLKHSSPKHKDSPANEKIKEESPSKFGTYDKKHRSSVEKNVDTTESFDYNTTSRRFSPNAPITLAKDNVSPVRPSNSRESSPPNYGTYDKKHRTEEKVSTKTTKTSYEDDSLKKYKKTSTDKITDMTYTHKSPRHSVSPVKSPVKDSKYNHTTDFISIEKTREETDKVTKSHPRQLVTPSTSPTRKPKVDDTEPSTGQSSPTTSVSGFVYYSSPKYHEMVTDLDYVDYNSETNTTAQDITFKRPESLPVEKHSSPSKIPCRSPSPEKTSPTKESPIRKSSLKKPSIGYSPVSPTEKPPSSFKVSPEIDSQVEFSEHKVVKKDRPDKPVESPVKTKPPFERRETYEERCLKILGMIDDSTNKTVKRSSSFKEPKMTAEITEKSHFTAFDEKVTDTTKKDVTDLISHEKVDTKTKEVNNRTPVSSKLPSRDSSPIKLQDIVDRSSSSLKKNSLNDSLKKDNKPESETRNSVSPDRKPGYMKSTSSVTSKYEKTTTNNDFKQNVTVKTVQQSPDKEVGYNEPVKQRVIPDRKPTHQDKIIADDYPQKPRRSSVSPKKKPEYMKSTQASTVKTEYFENENTQEEITAKKLMRESPIKEIGYTCPEIKSIRDKSPDSKLADIPTRTSVSPERKPSNAKTITASTIKHGEKEMTGTYSTLSTSEKSDTTETLKKAKVSRLPSPTKTTDVVKEDITEFINSEREKEILDKVHRSLRKLSPDRDQRSPSREKSPGKSKISLQDLEITNKTTVIKQNVTEKDNEQNIAKPKASKMPLRNLSPTKKPPTTPSDKIADSPTTRRIPTDKSRSISPKKPISPTERPPSPRISQTTSVKPREQPKKSPPGNVSPTKTEKITSETKKTTQVTKQNSFTKSQATTAKTTSPSPTRKTDSELKRTPSTKNSITENVTDKKDESKFSRTTSDASFKNKKSAPQRVKSKPEIKVNDLSKNIPNKQTSTINTTPQRSTKLAPKPKSATALNTSFDDDDVLIDDVEQAKSSRENSPDRICPTPVNFTDDLQTPRYPDEVNEPDDEFRKRTHHTILETETIVDDIVEIDEEDELFVKKTDADRVTESDECLLSVTDKVSKFTNKIEAVTKPKEGTALFKDIERKVHSDFIDENLKSDECLLSVSEKVNKFAKVQKDTKKSRSPSRRITDEYDVETEYQDEFTKLSINDKAHLFIETAEKEIKTTKTKPAQKVDQPDLDSVDENLKRDECMLSVSDKVNKFVKTAEQFLNESSVVEDKKVKEEYEKFIKNIVNNEEDSNCKITKEDKISEKLEEKTPSFAKDTTSSHSKTKDFPTSNTKQTERTPTVKITTLRSSEAVKKAKALFENIATSQQSKDTKITKLTDIGVIRKSPKPDISGDIYVPKDVDSETDSPLTSTIKERPSTGTLTRLHLTSQADNKSRVSPMRQTTHSPEVPRSNGDNTATKTVLSRYPASRNDSIKHSNPDKQKTPELPEKISKTNEIKHTLTESDHNKPQEKDPGYLRSTKTSHIKEGKPVETVEVTEIVSTRRGSGKFGVELRRTSVERTTLSSERRRSSTEQHQPCIEDIFDLGLLEQMLEKVTGYEQRRRIRAQIRVVKKKMESERTETTYSSKSTKYSTFTNNKSPERRQQTKSPERHTKTIPQKTLSPERPKQTQQKPSQEQQAKPLMNGHAKEPSNYSDKRQRHVSPEKHRPAQTPRQPSPEKKLRTTVQSPAKTKSNRFNEYASAYMKKVGLNESAKIKQSEIKTSKPMTHDHNNDTVRTTTNTTEFESDSDINKFEERTETRSSSVTKSFSERTSSKDTIEIVRVNGKRSVSPEKKRSPQRHTPGERPAQRSPSPDFKRIKTKDTRETESRTLYEPESPRVVKKETIIKTTVEERPVNEAKKETVRTVNDMEKKIQSKQMQEEKPAWVTNRNLKKTTSESRTYSSKKIENEKSKYRAVSPSKIISKPIDVITSSYGPGPLDADGRPLFGIKALKKGATNYQVKGTVIRQEFHSRNGSEPEGSVSVTAYSTEPEDLERLLQTQGERPSRLHGLAAITTTKKFGGNTGTSFKDVHTKEDRASLEQFTQSDRKITDSRIESVADRETDKKDMRTIDILSDRKEQRALEKSSVRTEVKSGSEKREERLKSGHQASRERGERITVRQSSIKNLTEKYIKSASGEKNQERSAYPKAGLILRTAASKRDSLSSDSSAHAGLCRSDSAFSLGSEGEITSSTTRSGDGTVVTTSTTQRSTDGATVTSTTTTTCSSSRRGEKSFLDSSSKVTGVQDILTRMKNADIVIQEGDSNEDTEARALLNKFLGATVLMAGMQNYVTESQGGKVLVKESVRSESKTSSRAEDFDPEQCWDERVLRKHLEESTDYEQRRRLRARIRSLMAEQEACASAVTEALGASGETGEEGEEGARPREEEEVTVTSSVRRDSTEKTVSSSTTTKTSKVIESMTRPAPKPVSPFAKFRQLEKQNSTSSPPNSAKTPQSPGSAPYFKFTDPALQASAATIKERLLQWCRDKTRDYENVKLENFSTSWADGLAFCALVHHFLPDAFDYSQLTPERRRHNFTLAFKVADEKAGIYPLLDVDDMVAMKKPDWKCVFTYVQAIHRRFKDQS